MADVFNNENVEITAKDVKEAIRKNHEQVLRMRILQKCADVLLSLENLEKAGFSVKKDDSPNCIHISYKGNGPQYDFDVYLLKKEKEDEKGQYEEKLDYTFNEVQSNAFSLLLKYPPYIIDKSIRYTNSSHSGTENRLSAIDIDRSLLNFKTALEDYFASALSDDKNEMLNGVRDRHKIEWDRCSPKKIEVFFDLTAATLENNHKQVDIINLYLDDLSVQDIEKYFKLFDDEHQTFSRNNSKEFFIHATYAINVLMDKKTADLSFLKEVSNVLFLHIAAEQFLLSFLNGEPTDSIKEIKGIFNILLESQSHEKKRYTEIDSATSQHIILI